MEEFAGASLVGFVGGGKIMARARAWVLEVVGGGREPPDQALVSGQKCPPDIEG